jgi:hypothetical protein
MGAMRHLCVCVVQIFLGWSEANFRLTDVTNLLVDPCCLLEWPHQHTDNNTVHLSVGRYA